MKRTGCVRLYVGSETGSAKMLDFYNKGIDKQQALQNLLHCKKIGLETVGFFMAGALIETEKDLQESIDFAIAADFDFISVSELQTYPGTALFEQLKEQIDFSLFPYRNRFKDSDLEKKQILWQKKFYTRFYHRPVYLIKKIPFAVSYTREIVKSYLSFGSFLVRTSAENGRRDFM